LVLALIMAAAAGITFSTAVTGKPAAHACEGACD